MKNAVYKVETNLTVESGAGCGKTFRIMEYVASLLSEPNSPYSVENLAVITFTNKAAAELKQRTILRLREASLKNPAIGEQIKLMGNSRISTIHAFCARLLKENPVEAGIDPGFEILEDNGEFAHEVFIRWFKENLAAEEEFFRKFLVKWGRPLEIQDFGYGNSEDKSLEAFLLRMLEHRELELFVPENPDWQRMKDLQQQLAELASEFSGRAEADKLAAFFTSYGEAVAALNISQKTVEQAAAALGGIKFSPGNLGGGKSKEIRDEWKSTCGAIEDELRRHVNYGAQFPVLSKEYEDSRRIITSFISYYRSELKQAGYMDHTEILVATEELLRNEQVARRIRSTIKIFIVDEFQDTDPLQAKILQHLARDGAKSELLDKTLIIVGDPKQSIYGFRRADIAMYADLTKTVAQSGKRELLTVNRRSSQNIIHWVNKHFAAKFDQEETRPYQPEYVDMQPYENAPVGDAVTFVKAQDYDGFADKIEGLCEIEATVTARAIARLLAGDHDFTIGKVAPKDILVLFRNMRNMQAIYANLEALGIPVEADGGMPLYGRQEVCDAVQILKCLANPYDELAIVAALRGPCFNIADTELLAYRQRMPNLRFRTVPAEEKPKVEAGSVEEALACLSRWFERSRELSVVELWELICDERKLLPKYAVTFRGNQKVLNLLKFREILFGLRSLPFALAVDQVSAAVDSPPRSGQFRDVTTEEGGAVRLMTIHGAKGLESRVVYIADSASSARGPGSVQISSADHRIYYCLHSGKETPLYYDVKQVAALKIAAEEERLRYVATTRARELLLINDLPFLKMKDDGSVTETHIHHFIYSLWQTRDNTQTWTVAPETIPYLPYASLPKVTEKDKAAMAKEIAKMREMHARRAETVAQDIVLHSPSLAEAENEADEMQLLPRVEIEELASPELNELPRQDLGTLLHKMLELDTDEPLTVARSLLKSYRSDIAPEKLAETYTELRRRLDKKHLKAADEIHRELPVLFTADDGRTYNGSIDLVFRVGHEWYLADYKFSQRKAEDLPKQYATQMALYREALGKVGIEIKPENMILLGFRV